MKKLIKKLRGVSVGDVFKAVNGASIRVENVFPGRYFTGAVLGSDGYGQFEIRFDFFGKNMSGVKQFEFDIDVAEAKNQAFVTSREGRQASSFKMKIAM